MEPQKSKETFREVLGQVETILKHLDVSKIGKVYGFVYDILKPMMREITNHYPQ